MRRSVRLLALLVTAIGMLAVATAGLLVEREQGPPSRLSLNCLPYAQPDDVDGVNELIGECRGIVSSSRNVADLKRLLTRPTLYRPRFLRVPLP